jgi:hypothetical protein
MYKVSILGVFQYFLSLSHSVSIFLSFLFLIANQGLLYYRSAGKLRAFFVTVSLC